jgi:hypothetical protein
MGHPAERLERLEPPVHTLMQHTQGDQTAPLVAQPRPGRGRAGGAHLGAAGRYRMRRSLSKG